VTQYEIEFCAFFQFKTYAKHVLGGYLFLSSLISSYQNKNKTIKVGLGKPIAQIK
jgi:hypothetical protein